MFCKKCNEALFAHRHSEWTPEQIAADNEHAINRLVRTTEYLFKNKHLGDGIFIDHADGIDLRAAIAAMRAELEHLRRIKSAAQRFVLASGDDCGLYTEEQRAYDELNDALAEASDG